MGIDFLTHATAWSVDDLSPSKRAAYRRALAERGAMRARIDWLESFDPEAPSVQATIALLARRKISVDPTLVAYESKFLDPAKPKYRQNPARAVVPEMLEDWERCGTPTDNWTPEDYARMARAWPKLLRLVKRYHAGGVLLTKGSDVTNPWVIPGESIHQELELLVSAGIAPRDVIKIATRNGAEALGILNETGTIERGKLADPIVLDRDPLMNISETRSIAMVMQRGHWVRQ
jgi:imidazolonepropionase-like amidohydrolase